MYTERSAFLSSAINAERPLRVESAFSKSALRGQKRETRMHKMKVAVALSLYAATLLLAACNTTEGVGKDIEATGDAIADTANDVKN